MKKKKRKVNPWKILRFVIVLVIIGVFFSPYFLFRIKLVGDKNMIVDYGDEYSEPGYLGNVLGNDFTDDIVVNGEVGEEIGSYEITYSYKFLFYNIKKVRKVEIKDITGPEIVLEGDSTYELTVNTEYEEPGFSALDNVDGDVTDNVKMENNIDTSTIGEYEVVYTVSDEAGNESRVVRKVKVERLKPTQMSLQEYTLDGWYDDVKLEETEDMGDEYFNKIKIVGDSNIMNMYYNGYVDGNNAWAKPCLHAESYFNTELNIYGTGEKILLLDAVSKYKPEIILLNLGMFSTTWIEEDVFIEKSKELISRIQEESPDTSIILCSLFPILPGEKINGFKQEVINKYNFIILELAYEYDVKFLNVQEVLKGEDGYAKDGYVLTSDRYHLTPLGHRVFKDYIRKHALKEE